MMLISFLTIPVALIFKMEAVALGALAIWLLLVAAFTLKRLEHTSRSMDHVAEMIVTSIVIPFAALFWQHYGALKYRVLFL